MVAVAMLGHFLDKFMAGLAFDGRGTISTWKQAKSQHHESHYIAKKIFHRGKGRVKLL